MPSCIASERISCIPYESVSLGYGALCPGTAACESISACRSLDSMIAMQILESQAWLGFRQRPFRGFNRAGSSQAGRPFLLCYEYLFTHAANR